ncbi:MAG: hypothetical protein DRJ13_07735 [Bacteroidetes bacterium]|nr:MAG: hypothetical protein DRJ13_07735 [Bacteroidota bacterium]
MSILRAFHAPSMGDVFSLVQLYESSTYVDEFSRIDWMKGGKYHALYIDFRIRKTGNRSLSKLHYYSHKNSI